MLGAVTSPAVIRFLSTLSLRRATNGATHYSYIRKYFYPRSPCGERLGLCRCWVLSDIISIHALLAESDRSSRVSAACHWYFYPRSPCGERRGLLMFRAGFWAFLSTLSLRRATGAWGHPQLPIFYFYPRSPCGERLAGPSGPAFLYNFYPRSPCGERRYVRSDRPNFLRISIHALLAESDHKTGNNCIDYCDFYPRSPCGERQILMEVLNYVSYISIHALLAESDA